MQPTPQERRAKERRAAACFERSRRRFERRDLTIIEACADPNLIGVDLPRPWKACLKGLYGLPMDAGELALYRKHTGRDTVPAGGFREASLIIGRRGRKTSTAAAVIVYESLFREHHFAKGEAGMAPLIAQNRAQAKTAFRFVRGVLEGSRLLSSRVEKLNESQDGGSISLAGGVSIEIRPCTQAAVRGPSTIAAVCEEIAFWRDKDRYANPDFAILQGLRPGMLTHPFAKLLKISSPFGKRGELYRDWKHRPADVLVWHADAMTMNPVLPRALLERERLENPEAFEREWLAKFQDTVTAFLPTDAVDEAVERGVAEREPGEHRYVASLDAAFSGDRFVFGIAHGEGDPPRVVVDLLREWQGSSGAPVKLDDVVGEIAALRTLYPFGRVRGDQYCSEPIRQALEKAGIAFEEFTFSLPSKMGIYGSLKALLNGKRVGLLDHPQAEDELKDLEGEKMSGGNVRIHHPDGGHDDYADVTALLAEEVLHAPPAPGFLGFM